MIITGTSGSDSILGTREDDIITGGLGLDMMWGFQGDDTFVYNPRDFTQNGIDLLVTGGDGTDTILLKSNKSYHYDIADLENGGMSEIEVLSFNGTTSGIRLEVSVTPTFLTGLDSFPSVQDLTISGSSRAVVTDVLRIYVGTTTTPFPSQNFSYLKFEHWGPKDKVIIEPIFVFGGEMRVIGTVVDDFIQGSYGRDFFRGHFGDDILRGEAGRDKLQGGYGNDKLFGGADNDNLDGGEGADAIRGGTGNDLVNGAGGNDRLTGGKGQDDLTGGTGADIFIFNAKGDSDATKATRDVITDFSQAQGDRIDLSSIDARAGGGNQAFTFIGVDGFSSTKGELRYKQISSKTIVQGDVDGDGTKDFEIELTGLHRLVAGDFIL